MFEAKTRRSPESIGEKELMSRELVLETNQSEDFCLAGLPTSQHQGQSKSSLTSPSP